MNADNILSLLIVATVAVCILVRRRRRVKHIFIPDYKRGVRFVRGSFANILEPGSYQPFTLKEQIEIVDMRRHPIILERISYRDAWQNESFLSVGAQISVSDAHRATTMLKDQINDSMPIVRDTLRSVVSGSIADGGPEFRNKTVADITQAVNVELDRVGMKISDVEITELWSRPISRRTPAVSH